MKDSIKNLAMIDIAEVLLKENGKPLSIDELIKKVVEIKGIDPEDYDKLTQLYMDITQSAKFVYSGNDEWDLKERNLELWDKDGYAFVSAEEIEEELEEEEDDLEFTEFVFDEKEEVVEEEEDDEDDEELTDEEKRLKKAEEEKERKEEEAYIEVELPIKSTDEDDVDDDIDLEFDDYDEDDYNEIMDDYEDMYDDD